MRTSADFRHKILGAVAGPSGDVDRGLRCFFALKLVLASRLDEEESINENKTIMSKYFFYLSGIGIASVLCAGCSQKVVVVDPPTVEPAPVVETHVVYSPGENLTALTKVHESKNVCRYPYGGDNGRLLFFAVKDDGGHFNIVRKDNPIGAAVSQVTNGRSQFFEPSYCPSNNKVVFCGHSDGILGSDIYLADASQGGALTQVTNTSDFWEEWPRISRDGRKVAYERRIAGDVENTEIWLKDMQTNENIQLGLGRMPSFAPDGRRLVYVKNGCLSIINVDGTNSTQLTDAGTGTVSHPCFSPDGSKIVFQCRKELKSDWDLYVVDHNGNGLTQLTVNKSFDGEPYWANDGNIYFTSDRGGRDKHYQIWRFRYGAALPPVPTTRPTTTKKTETTTDTQLPYTGAYHTVQNGETITEIARRYGVTVKDLVRWNNLMTMTITPGMKLKVSAQ